MDGVTVGLIVGTAFGVIYLAKRYKKENISEKFRSEKCISKKKIYVYWSRNSAASKRPVHIFINGEFVGVCKKSRIAEFDHPREAFEITSLVPHNVKKVEIDEKGPIYILVDSSGKCERFYLEEEDNG